MLETLDRAVIEDKDAVGDAVMDKAYMVQLVDVQHRRGATGGKTFARVLGLQEPPRPPDIQIPSLPVCPGIILKTTVSLLVVFYLKFLSFNLLLKY